MGREDHQPPGQGPVDGTTPIAFTATSPHHAVSFAGQQRFAVGPKHRVISEGVDVMSKKKCSFLVVSFLSLAILGGLCAVVHAEEGKSPAGKPALWSDPATWPDHQVPRAGDKVTIDTGKHVVLDISPPPLGGLHIDGKLSFSDKADLQLTTEWITLRGELEIGTEAKPHTRKATITLTDNVPGEEISSMGDRGIMIMGGTLNLHGDRTNSWTKLAKTAEQGSTSIQVLDAKGWRAGDQIVLASTDFDPHQAERRTISGIKGNTITLDKKLDYMHYGRITFGVDERGEVGMLTRNILIQASPDADKTLFGGHVMAMATSRMYISGVEFNRMGQNMHLARYPVHWHLVGDAAGQYIQNSAIHDTYSRCVTVHGTNDVRVENNVTYNNIGHCFFLEDGIEHGNQFVHNLGILTKCHPDAPCIPTNLAAAGEPRAGTNGQAAKDILIPSDNTASTFWITNPDNIYVDNVAAGSESNGFWMSLPEHPTGAFQDTDISKATWPRRTKFREFKGNVAHSNYDSFMFDRNVAPNGTFGVTGSSQTGLENPSDPDSRAVESVFEDLTAYKNRNGGIWGRGEMHVFRNVRLADNAIDFTHASGAFGRYAFTSLVVDSLFVGETENIGNPRTDAEKAYGRSLPKPDLPDYPIHGYEYYDYRHDVVNDTFMNFQDNATRKAGAVSYLFYTSAGISSNNSIEHAKFVNAKPVYFPPMERKWGNDNVLGNAAYKTAVIRDVDGSFGGGPDSYVLINDGVNDSIAADDQACEIKPDWNAAVCRGDVGRLSFGGPPRAPRPAAAPAAGGAAGPGPGFGAPPAAGAGAGGPGGPPPRGGGFGFGGPPQPPIVLSRNGKDYPVSSTNVRAGTEIKVTTERPSVNLALSELNKGSWVIFQLPGFTKAASGTPQSSLDALRAAGETSYFKDTDALWVKIVSNGYNANPPYGGGPAPAGPGLGGPGFGENSVQVSR
jgi:cell migration-inducing and hyaluronan-binding protein